MLLQPVTKSSQISIQAALFVWGAFYCFATLCQPLFSKISFKINQLTNAFDLPLSERSKQGMRILRCFKFESSVYLNSFLTYLKLPFLVGRAVQEVRIIGS